MFGFIISVFFAIVVISLIFAVVEDSFDNSKRERIAKKWKGSVFANTFEACEQRCKAVASNPQTVEEMTALLKADYVENAAAIVADRSATFNVETKQWTAPFMSTFQWHQDCYKTAYEVCLPYMVNLLRPHVEGNDFEQAYWMASGKLQEIVTANYTEWYEEGRRKGEAEIQARDEERKRYREESDRAYRETLKKAGI